MVSHICYMPAYLSLSNRKTRKTVTPISTHKSTISSSKRAFHITFNKHLHFRHNSCNLLSNMAFHSNLIKSPSVIAPFTQISKNRYLSDLLYEKDKNTQYLAFSHQNHYIALDLIPCWHFLLDLTFYLH